MIVAAVVVAVAVVAGGCKGTALLCLAAVGKIMWNVNKFEGEKIKRKGGDYCVLLMAGFEVVFGVSPSICNR